MLIALELSRIWPPVHPANSERVAALAAHLAGGGAVPPVRAVEGPPGLFRITDGAHRVAAAAMAGRTHVAAEVWHAPPGD